MDVRRALGFGAAAAMAIALALGVSLADARRGGGLRFLCKPTIVNTVVHYCGPATGRLSIFPGVTFKNGTCRRSKISAGTLLSVGLGTRTQDVATNDGRRYFGVTVTFSGSQPVGGGVIAYSNGKRWGGAGVSFKGGLTSGSFVARGIRGSKGTATGSFRC